MTRQDGWLAGVLRRGMVVVVEERPGQPEIEVY